MGFGRLDVSCPFSAAATARGGWCGFIKSVFFIGERGGDSVCLFLPGWLAWLVGIDLISQTLLPQTYQIQDPHNSQHEA